MDPFTLIPSPLLLIIVKQTPNFANLQNLLLASPCIASLFDECGLEIVEAVASSNLSKQLHHLLQTVAKIRSGALSGQEPQSIFDLINGQEHDDRLPDLSSTVLRELVSVGSNIQRLAYSCLRELLARCKNIRPSHLLDPKFKFTDNAINEWPPGIAYSPQDCGPPSWVEEERILRALWRLQIFFDLSRGTPDAPRPESRPRKFQNVDACEFWKALSAWELDEIECVYEYLQDITDKDSSNFTESSGPADSTDRMRQLPVMPPVDMEEAWSAASWELDAPQNLMRERKEFALRASPGFNFFRTLRSLGRRSPLHGANFRDFRCIGFGIWSMKRLCGLKVWNWPAKVVPPRNGLYYRFGVDEWMSTENILFTWRSIQAKGSDSRGNCEMFS
jgi:hypothetical protein